MRILHILYESKGDYFGIGGVGMRAYEIYTRLKERHKITLLCKKYPGARDREIEGLCHIFVGSESRSLTVTLLSYAYKAALFVREKAEEFDLIVEEFSPAVPTFLHAITKKPVVLQVQGYTGRLYFRKYNPVYASVLSLLERFRPSRYSNFIFINRETERRLSPDAGKNIKIIPNGVDLELLDLPLQQGGYIFYLGRIDVYGKGLDLLANAYAEFYTSFPGVKLVIAGDGRDMEEFKSILMGLPDGARRNVELTGWVTGKRKKEVLQGARFAVFPSRHEIQPIAVLEALACGKSVVVSDIPEFGFVLRQKAGLSFKTGDASSLAASMKSLAESDESSAMGRSGKEWVKTFTWDRIAEQYEKFLLETLERRK